MSRVISLLKNKREKYEKKREEFLFWFTFFWCVLLLDITYIYFTLEFNFFNIIGLVGVLFSSVLSYIVFINYHKYTKSIDYFYLYNQIKYERMKNKDEQDKKMVD